MKTKLCIFVLSLAFVVMQACSPSTEKKQQASDTELSDSKQKPLTPTERQAKLENDRIALEQQRKLALEELVKTSTSYELPNGGIVFYVVETEPSFVGGTKAMNKFLKDNLKYPKDAEADEQEGTVYVDFIVAENGTITNSEVISYTYENIDQAFIDEAIRVVKMMPAWSPGLQNGKPVAVKYSIPITFQLM